MRSTLVRLAAEATHSRTPMIQFLGKRANLEHKPHAPSPHPAAPQDIADNFQSFLSKLQSSSTSASSPSSNPKGQSLESSAQGHVRDHSGSKSSGSTPAAPPENKGSGKPVDYEAYFQAPERLWRPKMFSPEELEAIESGGANGW